MHVQTKGEPFERFSSLILVLYFNSLSLLIVQLCLTIYQASGRDKCFPAESQILQDILFCFGGFFCWFFPLLPVILSCPFIFPSLPFVFAISFFPCGFFHCSFLLGALCTIPVHYLSFPNTGFAFPNIIRLILTLLICAFLLALLTFFIQSWEESVRRSDSPESSILRHGQENGLITSH